MDIYLVGGAVRDALLGLTVYDKDYVVVGAKPEQLLQLGYQQVGKDFPVFLHPHSKDEYALARTERKAGRGYTGFICEFGPEVTLEDDLSRRDLTINAIAQQQDGTLIDPYGGQQDIANRSLRHVSDAFIEDPLRVLRVARFAARFHRLGFSVAPETQVLMQQMATSGELTYLTAERVWKETEKALACDQPQVFFEVLHSCYALQALFPELATANAAGMAPASLPSLLRSVALSASLACRFAVLCQQLDTAAINDLCQRIKVPTEYKELALLASRWHRHIHHLGQPSLAQAQDILALYQATDAWRRPERFQQLLLCAQADSGRDNYPQRTLLWQWLNTLKTITAQPFVAQGLKGPAIGEAIHQARLERLKRILESVRD
ncbi:MAG: multifunctional CCA addition/repair protein [Oceanisphaera sp.]